MYREIAQNPTKFAPRGENIMNFFKFASISRVFVLHICNFHVTIIQAVKKIGFPPDHEEKTAARAACATFPKEANPVKISTKGRYALRMMADIAEHQKDGYVTLKDVALRQGISKKYLEQIALHISQAGMLRAVRGYQGGYMLARPASKYTVHQILEVV